MDWWNDRVAGAFGWLAVIKIEGKEDTCLVLGIPEVPIKWKQHLVSVIALLVPIDAKTLGEASVARFVVEVEDVNGAADALT